MKDITIELLMGLPGSGKTHYAKNHENRRVGVYAVILDELSDIRCYGKRHSMEDLIHLGVCDVYRNAKKIILDGPFFTNEHIRVALHVIAQEYGRVDVTYLSSHSSYIENSSTMAFSASIKLIVITVIPNMSKNLLHQHIYRPVQAFNKIFSLFHRIVRSKRSSEHTCNSESVHQRLRTHLA